ncbi:VOC family protein [Auraticoccus monumenti]|uniref:PhnB protein n=1 Tax=Auraticoccus monumenti TaxID=675864 RepID=A0A1G6SMT8_9ACTN|nr:VOC family protein [Auraticoccus monumenti]SDD18148.1 PhnB protein [Auraticoccus monumenti]
MAARLNPYLMFDGRAREAMEFYHGVFGGELSISTFGEYGDPSAEGADGVMHAQLDAGELVVLMGSDLPPGTGPDLPANGTLSLSGDDAAALRGYWDRLAADGTVTMPLEKQMWGDEYGQCTDRFGVSWMVNIAGSGA